MNIRKSIGILLKYTLNPVTRKLAKTPFGPFALVRHIGRKSGRQYETPLILGTVGSDFVAELTYGPEVDWYKNVVAAGGCTVVWHGRDYVINRIDPLDIETGMAAFPLMAQMVLRLTRRRHFVKMQVA